ncbi:MAG TPA: class I SAM-dependent methyltransferase [Acidimicrobiia bacterium]
MAHSEIERWSGFKSWAFSLVQGNAKRNLELVRFAGIGPGDRVLDIGCGPGAALEAADAAGAESVSGVDSSPSMVIRASRRVPSAVVKEGSAEAIPFDDEAFTAVWSIATFHHWADRDTGLGELFRVLAPGGAFYLVEGELKPGKKGHGLTKDSADDIAQAISADFGVPCRAERLAVRRSKYFVILGSK